MTQQQHLDMSNVFTGHWKCKIERYGHRTVEHIFNSQPPVKYSSGSLQPIEGINVTMKCDDAEDIQASFCSISDYLNNHLPDIVKSLALNHNEEIIKNTNVFYQHFNAVLRRMVMSQQTRCYHRNVTTSDDYERKVIGLKILYFTRRWVKSFLGTEAFCG
ncbi:hypothetical protein F2P81_013967 [Scomber scombrus]|uniref:Uncharacterized protein n=1 Tax=Scomber scombrus TaxID=13677 RepID=A0AAV1P7W3_SCOSC